MRKGVTTYKELGFLRVVMRKDIITEVRKQHPNAFQRWFSNERMEFWVNKQIDGVTHPVLVANAYAVIKAKPNDGWYFQMQTDETQEDREKRLIREHQTKKPTKFVLNFKKLRELAAKRRK